MAIEGAPGARERLASLQLLRAGAALGVVVYHLGDALTLRLGLPALPWLRAGQGGVDVFFVVSGFVMCLTTVGRDASPAHFLAKRFARLVPLYWALTLALFAVAAVLPDLLGRTEADPVHLVKSLLFVPYERGDGSIYPVLFLGWTLNLEVFFYLVFAACLPLGARAPWACGAALCAVVVWGAVASPEAAPLRLLTEGIVLDFVLGCAVWGVWRRWPGAAARWHRGWPIAAMLLGAGIVSGLAFVWPRPIVCGLPAAALVLCALGAPVRDGRSARWGERLGDASYSIYLIHPYVIVAAAIGASAVLGPGGPAGLVTAAVSVPLTVALALASYRLIERPSNDRLRARLGRRGAGRPPPAEATSCGTGRG